MGSDASAPAESAREKAARIAAAARAETQAIYDNRIILPQEKKQKTEVVSLSTLPSELLLAALQKLWRLVLEQLLRRERGDGVLAHLRPYRLLDELSLGLLVVA